jgi:hypothetical protein
MTSIPTDARPLHILEVRTRGVVVEARLNDIPVFAERLGRGRLFQVKCEPYLVTGENELRLWLRLPGGSLVDDEARDGDATKVPYCRVRVVRLDTEVTGEKAVAADASTVATAAAAVLSGATGTAASISAVAATGGSDAPRRDFVLPHDLAAWAWDPEHDPLLPGRSFEAGPWFFSAESRAGRWSWEQAPPYRPSSEDPAEIRVLVEKLWRAVSFLDVDAVVHLTREKTRELAVALGVNAAELESDQAGYLSSLFASPGWMIAPLEQEAIVLEPAAAGRLVDVRTVDGEAPIRGGDGKRFFIIRPMVAKVKGRWRVVR